jgi:hypothetical protein
LKKANWLTLFGKRSGLPTSGLKNWGAKEGIIRQNCPKTGKIHSNNLINIVYILSLVLTKHTKNIIIYENLLEWEYVKIFE